MCEGGGAVRQLGDERAGLLPQLPARLLRLSRGPWHPPRAARPAPPATLPMPPPAVTVPQKCTNVNHTQVNK